MNHSVDAVKLFLPHLWFTDNLEGHPAYTKLSDGMLAWLSGARYRFAYGPADATAAHSLASVKSKLVLVPAHPGNLGQSPESHKTDVVCVSIVTKKFMDVFS